MNRQFYIKDTSNCQGMPLTNMEILSPIFRAEEIELRTQERIARAKDTNRTQVGRRLKWHDKLPV